MARWITIHTVPFDYPWPGRTAITAFTGKGEFYLKDEIADFAVKKGYATEGRASEQKTSAPKRATKGRAKATNQGRTRRVGGEDLADDGGAAAGRAVDPDAG